MNVPKKCYVFSILTLAILAYAGVLLVADYRRSWDRQADRIGQSLFPNLDVNAVKTVILTDAVGKLSIREDGGFWIVEKQNGYPADFHKLKELIKGMREARILNTYPIDESGISKLKLAAPGGPSKNAGCLVQLLGADNESLAAVIVGLPHTNGSDKAVVDGRYARIQGRSEAIILRRQLTEATSDSLEWIDRSFPSSKCARRIVSTSSDKVLWELSRENQSRLMAMDGLLKGQTINQDAVSQLEHALAYARYSELGDPDAPISVWGFNERQFRFEEFNGLTYTLDLGTVTPDALLPVRVSVELSENATPSEAVKKQLQREKRLYKGWIYLLPRATFTPMLMPRSGLLKGEQKQPDQTDFEEFPDEK